MMKAGLTDWEHAKLIDQRRRELNLATDAAVSAGLEVDISLQDITSTMHPTVTIVVAKVKRLVEVYRPEDAKEFDKRITPL
jgi:hypothetical protein